MELPAGDLRRHDQRDDLPVDVLLDEAEEKARQEAEEKARLEAEEQARKEAEEKAKAEAKEAEEQAKQEAKEAKEKAKDEALPPMDAKLYKGVVRMTIMPPINLAQIVSFEADLGHIESLRLLSVGGSAEEGTTVIVSAESPTPLISILREFSSVEEVVGKGNKIEVTLKAE